MRVGVCLLAGDLISHALAVSPVGLELFSAMGTLRVGSTQSVLVCAHSGNLQPATKNLGAAVVAVVSLLSKLARFAAERYYYGALC